MAWIKLFRNCKGIKLESVPYLLSIRSELSFAHESFTFGVGADRRFVFGSALNTCSAKPHTSPGVAVKLFYMFPFGSLSLDQARPDLGKI